MYALTLYNTYAGRTVAALAGIAALSVFLYGALLLGAVAHTAGRTSAEQEVRRLSAAVSLAEGAFLTKTKALSPERAAEMGFVAPIAVVTVYTGGNGLTLR